MRKRVVLNISNAGFADLIYEVATTELCASARLESYERYRRTRTCLFASSVFRSGKAARTLGTSRAANSPQLQSNVASAPPPR